MIAADVPAVVVLMPCQSEDSTDCYWNAQERGNGRGRSFVNIDGAVFYLGRSGQTTTR